MNNDIEKYFVSSKPTYTILNWLKELNGVYKGLKFDFILNNYGKFSFKFYYTHHGYNNPDKEL